MAETRERPILFSAPMILALLDGRKTQTRRIVKPQPPEGWSPLAVERYRPAIEGRDGMMQDGKEIFGAYDEDWGVACPFGGPGDRLWVRETFRETEDIDGRPVMEYRAGGTRLIVGKSIQHGEHCATSILPKWKPSIFMPRWASRLTLELIDVRVERLCEISDEDAVAEGLWYCDSGDGAGFWGASPNWEGPKEVWGEGSIDCFARLWEHINGPGSWESNPWVWTLEFKRV